MALLAAAAPAAAQIGCYAVETAPDQPRAQQAVYATVAVPCFHTPGDVSHVQGVMADGVHAVRGFRPRPGTRPMSATLGKLPQGTCRLRIVAADEPTRPALSPEQTLTVAPPVPSGPFLYFEPLMDLSGWWTRADSDSGEGWLAEHTVPDRMPFSWVTCDFAGNATWFVMQSTQRQWSGALIGPVYRSRREGAARSSACSWATGTSGLAGGTWPRSGARPPVARRRSSPHCAGWRFERCAGTTRGLARNVVGDDEGARDRVPFGRTASTDEGIAMINRRHLGVVVAAAIACAVPPAQAQLVISEFRVRGPNGANDEFIQLTNVTGAGLIVVASGGTGYGVAASDGVTRCTVPNGTAMPAGGHFLCVNSIGYSLAGYPAAGGGTATGNATFTTGIADNAGIAVFTHNLGGVNYALAQRMDAVGSTTEANALYKEGAGYPALTPFSIDYAFQRDLCGKQGSITAAGLCPTAGALADSNSNAADFVFVDSNGTSAGAGQRLGAPGPENQSSPRHRVQAVRTSALDSCAALSSPPNRVRDFTSDPGSGSTFGTLDLRRSFRNTSGSSMTRLRFRVIDLTTFPAPGGTADLRPRTSSNVVVTVDRPPCGAGFSSITVRGTTLEQPPAQPNGGGYHSTLSAGIVSLAAPLASGASVDLRFLFGIQQTGSFRIGLLIESAEAGSSADPLFRNGFEPGYVEVSGATN